MNVAIARWHSNARPSGNDLEQAYADRLETEMQEMAIQLHQVRLTAKLRYIELRCFELVLSNNGKRPGYSQCKEMYMAYFELQIYRAVNVVPLRFDVMKFYCRWTCHGKRAYRYTHRQ